MPNEPNSLKQETEDVKLKDRKESKLPKGKEKKKEAAPPKVKHEMTLSGDAILAGIN